MAVGSDPCSLSSNNRLRQAKRLRVIPLIVREVLRRIDHFRAYRKYPKLNLPTTTGSLEAMNRRVFVI